MAPNSHSDAGDAEVEEAPAAPAGMGGGASKRAVAHLLQMRSETERVVVVDLAQPPPPDEAPGLAPSGIALEGRV